jgi:phospholipid-translocating ATPase
VFIRTDQLDGETDWKLRKAANFTHQYLQNNNQGKLIELLATVSAEAPKLDIYAFEGCLKLEASSQNQESREGLNLENTLWGNCFLANGKAIGIVIYTGREMRSVMNAHDARQKIGRTDAELNYLAKVLFGFMVVLAILIVFSGGLGEYWLLDIFRQILLLCSIIPISLRVNLDISKAVFSHRINTDKEIEGAIARNSQIPEELGRIHYIMSDKTGTLTQNEMVFKKLAIHNVGAYTAEDQKLLRLSLKKSYEKTKGPMEDVEQKVEDFHKTGKKINLNNRSKMYVLRDFAACLAVCHNVTPTMENDVKTYQASSPDEIALVNIA